MNTEKIHPTEILHYEGIMEYLVDFIVGELRYDKAAEFHALLAKRYAQEARDEMVKLRPNLSEALSKVSESEAKTAALMQEVWKICEPFTK